MHKWWIDITPSWTLFLDRDGVINTRIPDGYVTSVSELELLPGVTQAIAHLNSLFGRTVVVTNQQGIGKGLMSEADLKHIHLHVLEQVQQDGGSIDAFYFCPLLAHQTPNCRKPGPSMAHQAKRDFPEIVFSKSVMVGDSPSDIQFGTQLQMQTVLIANRSTADFTETAAVSPDLTCGSLTELAALFTGT